MLLYTNRSSGQCGCECGHLPYTVTATFSGLPEAGRTAYRRVGAGACFGSGAEVVLLEPGGNDDPVEPGDPPSDRGPITAVRLLAPGSCYARRGRVAPELAVNPGQGGASFTVAMQQQADSCGLPFWAIQAVGVQGGTGYVNNSTLLVQLSAGDTAELAAVLRLRAGVGGVPAGVDVLVAGRYYREVWTNDTPAYVANVVFTVQGERSGDQPAVIRGIVDADVLSHTFGQVTGVFIEDGGSGHLAWRHREGCLSGLNGETVVLRADTPKQLVRICGKTPWGAPPTVSVQTGEYDGVPGPIPGITYVLHGEGLAKKGRSEPVLAISGFVGSGAAFTPTFEEMVDGLGFHSWAITEVSASGNGQGYGDGQVLRVETVGGGHAFLAAPTLRVRTRVVPTVAAAATTPTGFGGTLAALAATLVRNPGFPATWSVDSVEIQAAGSGYPARVPVTFSVLGGGTQEEAASAVAHTGDNGELLFVRLYEGGKFYLNTDRAVEVQVVSGGAMYRERDDLPPYVAPLEMVVEQVGPSQGSGAVVSAVIDTNPVSATFGRTTGVTLVNGGDNYSLLGGPFGLGAGIGLSNCRYSVPCESGGSLSLDLLVPRIDGGKNYELEMVASGSDGVGLDVIAFSGAFRSGQPVLDASSLLPILASSHDIASGTVSLEPGGRYRGPQGPCCRSCPATEWPESLGSVTVTVQLSYEPQNPVQGCSVNETLTFVLENAEQVSQPAGFLSVEAGVGWIGGSFFTLVRVAYNGQCGWPFGFVGRELRMEAVRVGDDCCPVGFDDWEWQHAPPGAAYRSGRPGNEIPSQSYFEGLNVTVSASVALK